MSASKTINNNRQQPKPPGVGAGLKYTLVTEPWPYILKISSPRYDILTFAWLPIQPEANMMMSLFLNHLNTSNAIENCNRRLIFKWYCSLEKSNKARTLLADYCHSIKRRPFFFPETSRNVSNICRRAVVIGVKNDVCFLRLMHFVLLLPQKQIL